MEHHKLDSTMFWNPPSSYYTCTSWLLLNVVVVKIITSYVPHAKLWQKFWLDNQKRLQGKHISWKTDWQLHMAIYMPVWIAHWTRVSPAFQSLSISVQLEIDLFCLCFSLLFLPLNNNQPFIIWEELKLNLNLVSIAKFKSIDSLDEMMSFKG